MQGFDDYLQIIQLKPKLVPNITDIMSDGDFVAGKAIVAGKGGH